MSDLTELHNEYAKYVYLHVSTGLDSDFKHTSVTIHVKMDDEGIVVDAWQEDEVIASTWKTYADMGFEVRELLTIEKQQKEREDE